MTAPGRLKVLILGGTGVFGSNLARMLLEDGHEVIVTSRVLARAQAFTKVNGGTPLAVDRDDDLAQHLNGVNVLVDAAGPFQDYGGDPYRVARQALENGVHYLDFSDDAGFTTGISTLNTLASGRGLVAFSGVSSVPALSSAAVTELARDMPHIDRIEMAILPGNRAPRGLSVMRAILGQVGAPMRLWRSGKWTQARGWSEAKTYALAPDLKRKAALIGSPDLALFPEHYNTNSVEFRAGLELGIMQNSLSIVGWLRARKLFPNPARFTKVLHGVAGWLEGFGSDRGGMIVEVSDGEVTRRWVLLAEAGDGPFIPAIPALIAVGKLSEKPYEPGARPALDIFTLSEAEAMLSRLDTTCTHT